MSLVNDALKRAKEAQAQAAPRLRPKCSSAPSSPGSKLVLDRA
jgi:hypothetical protein